MMGLKELLAAFGFMMIFESLEAGTVASAAGA